MAGDYELAATLDNTPNALDRLRHLPEEKRRELIRKTEGTAATVSNLIYQLAKTGTTSGSTIIAFVMALLALQLLRDALNDSLNQ